MQSYIETFSEPTVGRKHNLENGKEIIVSARLLTQGTPYNQVTHIDPCAKECSVQAIETGTLLIEARDPSEPREGTIAYCVLRLEREYTEILEMEVAYPYRGYRIMQALTALSEKLTNLPLPELSEDCLKYL